jgi:hypothetical protein
MSTATLSADRRAEGVRLSLDFHPLTAAASKLMSVVSG